MVRFKTFEDVIKFAIEREVEAYQLYQKLAEEAENVGLYRVMMDFAKEELRHKAKLEMEIIKTGKTVPGAEVVMDFEYADHLEHYDPQNVKYQDLLRMAIAKEKKSFRFYVELAGKVEDEEIREALMSLAEEEARHKVTLEIEYDVIMKK